MAPAVRLLTSCCFQGLKPQVLSQCTHLEGSKRREQKQITPHDNVKIASMISQLSFLSSHDLQSYYIELKCHTVTGYHNKALSLFV